MATTIAVSNELARKVTEAFAPDGEAWLERTIAVAELLREMMGRRLARDSGATRGEGG